MNHPEETPPPQVSIDSGPLKLGLWLLAGAAFVVAILVICYLV